MSNVRPGSCSSEEGVIRVLDLFAGLQGWATPWRERGHECVTLDIDPDFGCDLALDIFDFKPSEHLPKGWVPDVILASPPCEGFTVMTIGRNWTGPNDTPPHSPKTPEAEMALAIVERTRAVIDECAPTFFVIENPRAKLRQLPVIGDLERVTVAYCQYGETWMKPTDLWGGFPVSWAPKLLCRTDRTKVVVIDGEEWRVDLDTGRPCHHAAPRGSRKGIQGDLSGPERAKVPAMLSLAICEAAERDL